ncbi:MAG: hypothetical protein KatS3mg108_1128 [Isosphaeraceae bacterium]|jgi:hypothetical protein|nr:MAG: hypothetical protein KatS3mg108_1128 [Isosphaeraceae bacterium]
MRAIWLHLALLAVGQDLKESGPHRLFDGRSLEGWAVTDFRNAGPVRVEDGAIVLGTGRPMTGITSTRQDLPTVDYELCYEASRIEGRDFFAAATFPVGMKFLTLVNGGWGGTVTGLSSLDGADASENETTTSIRYENGRWYRFRIWVTQDRVLVWVDEKPVIDVTYAGRDVRTRLEVRPNQPLGFATWETTGRLRAISVRRLTDEDLARLPRTDD